MHIEAIKEQPLVGVIYSCNARCWRKIAPSNFHYPACLLNSEQPVIVNESFYWLNLQINSILTVISFDIRHEVFRLLPDSFDEECGKDYVLMNMRDSIALMCYDWTLFFGSAVDVYIFNERCNVWSKMYIGPFVGKEPSFVLGQKFLMYSKHDVTLFGGPDLKLYCVNPQTHTIKSLESPERKGDKVCYTYDCCTYSESLIFIEGMEKLSLYDDYEEVVIDIPLRAKHLIRIGRIFECCYTQIKD